MRLAHARAGWALITASTLGVAVAVTAPASLGAAFGAAPTRFETAPPIPLADAQARLVEIKVELAWLADASTFPCELAPMCIGGALEVGGMVPSDAMRQRVLQVAREQGRLPVIDKLVVQPCPDLPKPHDPNYNLCRSAADAVTKVLADHPETFEVAADHSGQVTVTGTVFSCEEKLRVSRRLSRVPGCTSVVNNLKVARVLVAGKVHTKVSSDGRYIVPGEPHDLLPIVQPTRVMAAPESAPVAEAAPAPTEPAPKVTPVAFVAPAPAEPSKFAPPPLPPKAPAAPQTQLAPRTEPHPFVAASAAVPLPPKPETKPAPVLLPVVYNQPASTGPSLRQAATAPVPVPMPMPMQVASVPASPYAGAVALSRQSNQVLASKFGASPYAGAVAQATPQVFSPVPMMAVAVPQPVAAAPAPMVVQRAAAPQPTSVPSALVRHQLKQRVEAVCGKAASDVEVNVQPNKRLVVQMKARTKDEGEQLGLRIMALPELAPYQVDLAISVKP